MRRTILQDIRWMWNSATLINDSISQLMFNEINEVSESLTEKRIEELEAHIKELLQDFESYKKDRERD